MRRKFTSLNHSWNLLQNERTTVSPQSRPFHKYLDISQDIQKFPRYLENMKTLRKCRDIQKYLQPFWLGPVFSLLFLEAILQFYARNNSVRGFPTRKMYSISLKALKQQFSKMAYASNIEAPEQNVLSQLLLLQENFENFCLRGSNLVYF